MLTVIGGCAIELSIEKAILTSSPTFTWVRSPCISAHTCPAAQLGGGRGVLVGGTGVLVGGMGVSTGGTGVGVFVGVGEGVHVGVAVGV